jgi:YidC/Oxa1 family membrane protein insertase
MSNKLFRPILFILIFLLVFQFFSKKNEQQITQDDVMLSAKSKITIGKDVVIEIKNHSGSPIIIPDNCPKNPLTVERYMNGEWMLIEAEITPEECADKSPIEIAPKENYLLHYKQWGLKLFNEEGRYRITLKTRLEDKEKTYSYEFTITPPSLIHRLWSEIFYKPILNTLVFLIFILPNKNLGWGIILLTLIIKILLLIPNHKALKAQKAMQKIQPQLDALKIKYKNDPQRLAQETMEIWKKYKVSPMSSCLPILIQFPILIALFYVVKDGLGVIDPALLYNTLKDVDLTTINPNFLGLINLTKVSIIALPVIVGGMQFIQMRLTLGNAQAKLPAVKDDQPNTMLMMNKMMQYFMPIMIAVFTAGLPAAVGFYWGTSTLFGICQQLVVNKSKD